METLEGTRITPDIFTLVEKSKYLYYMYAQLLNDRKLDILKWPRWAL